MIRSEGWAMVVAVAGAAVPATLFATPTEVRAPFAVYGSEQSWPAGDAAVAATLTRARAALDLPPGAVAELHTEGTLPGHGIRDASIAAKRDHPIALDLAIAWRVTGERPFRDQAVRYLTAWADIYRPSFNPIDETGFDALILATDLVRLDMPAAEGGRLDAFWRGMAIGYLDAMDGEPRNAQTNWQSHRIKLATLAAYRTGDAELIARARAAFRKQIAVNLRADGSTFDFAERDALHYVTYNLDPLLTAALAARAHGDDWYDYVAPTGASLPRSVAWLAAFARGERVHQEFVHSRIAFDRERATAGQDEYAPHPWKRANALNTFALAATFDPAYLELRDRLATAAGRPPSIWLTGIKR